MIASLINLVFLVFLYIYIFLAIIIPFLLYIAHNLDNSINVMLHKNIVQKQITFRK